MDPALKDLKGAMPDAGTGPLARGAGWRAGKSARPLALAADAVLRGYQLWLATKARFSPTERQRLFGLTIAIGGVCGLVAVAFHQSIRWLEGLTIERAFAAPGDAWIGWVILVPSLGALLAGVLLHYVPGAISRSTLARPVPATGSLQVGILDLQADHVADLEVRTQDEAAARREARIFGQLRAAHARVCGRRRAAIGATAGAVFDGRQSRWISRPCAGVRVASGPQNVRSNDPLATSRSS